MAASVSAWSKPGKWALDAEEHEEELLQQKQPDPPAVSADFPSLSAAATTKKKKKGQTISLAEFATYGSSAKATYSAPSHTQTKNIFDEAPLSLPSGPRERTAEELDRTRLGGGFRSYGGRGGEDSSSRWGSGRASDEGRKFGGEPSRDSGPSRADEADDWGATKKSTFGNGFDRRDRDRERGERGGFFDSQSRADESDSWVSNKSSAPTEGRRFVGFDRERRGGFEREISNGGGADSDTWGRKREDSGPLSNGRPRLVLQPRTLPVSPVAASPVSPAGIEKTEKLEAPVIVPKQKTSNPFGQARPREEVLAEKGLDWKEIDEKLETTKIKETTEKVERGDRLSSAGGRRSFGSGNGSWRKPGDVRPDSRSGSVENGEAEENGREVDEQGDARNGKAGAVSFLGALQS